MSSHTSQTLPRRLSGGTGSYTWAEVVAPDGHIAVAELVAGEGVRSTAAIAAETTRRVLAGVAPGAWTPGQLFGAALVTDATGAQGPSTRLRRTADTMLPPGLAAITRRHLTETEEYMEIDTLEGVQLGGITQWIRVRGADAPTRCCC